MMEFKERNTLSLTPTLSQREREKGGSAPIFKACAERFPLKGQGERRTGGPAPIFNASAERFLHPKGEGERRIGIGIQGLCRTVPSPTGRGLG